MARTRGQIKTLVEGHTGRTKATLENSLCDSALKVALLVHPFRDAISMPSDITITEDNTSVDISSISNILDIITARIVEASGTQNKPLIMKNRTWWDRYVINAEDNQKGWPNYGMRWSTTVLLDRPAESGLELRLRVLTEQTFTDDNTTCPISVLDLFVEKYVTAHVFKEITNWEAYYQWMKEAVGPNFDRTGEPGGELLTAVTADKADTSEELHLDRYDGSVKSQGVSIRNLITGAPNYGNTEWWR